MKFLCDVHISYKLVKHIEKCGYEALHVNSILDKWFTKDSDITAYADDYGFIVITKDSDFRDSHLLKKQPKKLIKVNLGNISNNLLVELFNELLTQIQFVDLKDTFLIELDDASINLTV